MSNTIDQRILEMRFDNKQFESGIKTSMDSLSRFEKGLQLKGASNGLSELDRATKSFSLAHLSNSVDAIAGRFSALGIMGVTALQNIANQAYHTAERMVKSLTVEPIMAGFSEYETQINAIQTILANTQKDGTTLDDVTNALDELNAYADKTIYNFTEMTRNIGTFTAAGVKLDTATNAIQGIANLAAISGSTSQQASTAMYQLSQAMASGTVKLQDWISVNNAGMGGQIFQDSLKETSKAMAERAKSLKKMSKAQLEAYQTENGYTDEQIKSMKSYNANVDKMIEKHGSFRESLREGWITTDVLTETLEKFTATTEGLTEEQIAANREMWKARGYTDEQIDAIFEMGKTATDAATKVKTFTQLFDTLKEAAQSGWTQSWEILIGDFEEAKYLLTAISDEIGGIINQSAAVRNTILQGWKDAGGRDDLIAGFTNLYNLLGDLIKPARDAFEAIFPATTDEKIAKLKSFTQGFEDFTKKLTVSPDMADKLKRSFKGFFAIVDIGAQALSALASGFAKAVSWSKPVASNLLDMTASLGDYLVGLSNTIRETDIFNTAMDKIGVGIKFVIDMFERLTEKGADVFGMLKDIDFSGIQAKFKQLAEKVAGVFDVLNNIDLSGIEVKLEPIKSIADACTWVIEKLQVAFQKALPYILKFGSYVSSAFANLSSSVSDAVQNGTITELASGGVLAALVVGITKVANAIANIRKSAKGVTGALGGMQNKLNAEALKNIAIAVAILAGSLVILSMANQYNLGTAIASITTMFIELIGALKALTMVVGNLKPAKMTAAVGAMIGMAAAVLILAGAMAIMSSLDPNSIAYGLGAVVTLIGMMTVATKKLGDGSIQMMKGAGSLIAFAFAIGILAACVKVLGSMNPESMLAGISALAAILLELGAFLQLSDLGSMTASAGIGLMGVAMAMVILAAAVFLFGSMDTATLGQGLLVVAVGLGMLALAAQLLPSNLISAGVGLMAIAASLLIVGVAMHIIGAMSFENLITGLTGMGVALLLLVGAANMMQGSVGGAAAILIMSAALIALGVALQIIGAMSVGSLVTALVGLAATLAILGVAAALLTPVIPAMLGLSVALLAFAAAAALGGVALIALGAGLTSVGVGIVTLVTSIITSITTIVGAIATIAEQIGAAIVAIANAISAAAPACATAVSAVIQAIVDVLANGIVAISGAIDTAGPAILKLAGFLIALGAVCAVIAPLTPAIVAVSGALTAFGISCAAIAAGVTLLAGALALLGASGMVVANAMADIYNTINSMGDLSMDAVKSASKTFLSAGKKASEAVVEGFSSGLKSSGDSFSTALTAALLNGVTNSSSIMTSSFVILVNSISTILVSSYGRFQSIGVTMVSKLASGVKSGSRNASNAISSVASSMMTTLDGYKKKSETIGGYIVDGLIKGMNAKREAPIQAARELGEAVEEAMKNSVGVASPSKNFAKIGMWIVQGLANGILKFSNLATNAATQLGNNAIQPVMTMTNDAISDLSSMGKAIRGTAAMASSFDSTIISEQYVTVNHTFDDLTVKGVNDRNEFIAAANYSVEQMLTELMRKGIRR